MPSINKRSHITIREYPRLIGKLVATELGVEYGQLRYKPLERIKEKLKALWGSESNTHIQLYCDNTSSCAYLRNFGGKKRYLNVLAIDIWNWCISRSIHLSISHVAVCLNVEADELSRELNLNEDLE